ncbi:MAG: MFS transporter, partial [Bradymonadia bacterium]
MLYRFCTYAVLRNLRFFDAFFVLFLAVELGFTYTEIGIVLAYDKLLMGLLEVPLAIITDRFGRRRSLALSFALASVAFAVFGFAAQSDFSFLMILLGQTVYGVAESLRSGSHKAIVLDWLRHQGQSHKRVKVLGTMRFFSKNSAGIAALMAGGIVWLTGGMNALFFAAILPTLGVVVLVLGYPRFAEGELRRRMNDGNKPPRQNLRE